jgi:hypothetical protein
MKGDNYFGLFTADIPITQLEIADIYLREVEISDDDKKTWKPKTAAERTRKIYKRWSQITEQLLYEILLAYLMLRDQKNETGISFTEWCKMAGLPDANLVRKWILRYLDPDKYSVIMKKKEDRVEQSAIAKTLEPLIKNMDIHINSVQKDKVDMTIRVFGKEFRKIVRR